MATIHQVLAPAWSARLNGDFNANDQNAKDVAAGLSREQLNWRPSPASWSIGQCLEHLCITNEAYLPPLSAAVENKPVRPVEEITPGWFASWFIRSFVEPSAKSRRVPAPGRIRPGSSVDLSVVDRFLSGNQSYRDFIGKARNCDVNRTRFPHPFLPGIRFTVGAVLEIVAGHERRHLLQAKRVKESPAFPG